MEVILIVKFKGRIGMVEKKNRGRVLGRNKKCSRAGKRHPACEGGVTGGEWGRGSFLCHSREPGVYSKSI